MSGSTIKRGASPRKRAAIKGKARKPAVKQVSTWEKILRVMPFDQRVVDRFVTGAMILVFGSVAIAGATLAGVPQYIGTETAKAVGRAGFEVKRVEVTGIDRMERLTVYAIALDQHSMAMPLVDLEKVRDQLLDYGWIQDARVSRRLPDTLVVDIVERKPAAIWQHNQKLSLIDKEGVILEPVVPDQPAPELPLLIGKDANLEAVRLGKLMDQAPALKPMLASASWIGNRRWDLQFQSGEVLALPEGDAVAAKALLRFARIDGVRRLLGRGFLRFDMRDPTKFVARIKREQQTIDMPMPTASPNAVDRPAAEQGNEANGPA
ncbi:MAG: cell division protein FtsQ/DivIB [Pseudomonadota bacterium]